MVILALDTSSAAGSAALIHESRIVVERGGDGTRTHGERLPRELMAVLEAARVTLREIDRFAVAIGPGSFTGLRVGIATVQGLALAQRKLVIPISTFEALAYSSAERNRDPGTPPSRSSAIATWIDAHRGEVFATLYSADGATALTPPTALLPAATLAAWHGTIASLDSIAFTGDGAVKYREVIEAGLGGRAHVAAEVPLLAGPIGRIAAQDPGRAVRPHAVSPLYVRRPDAELARDRARQGR